MDLLCSLESSNDMSTEYDKYLRSEHWQSFRERFFKTSAVAKNMRRKFGGVRCEFCLADGVLHLHHKTYKRLGKEKLSDVVLICKTCHEAVHKRHRSKKNKGLWDATNRVRKRAKKHQEPKRNSLRGKKRREMREELYASRIERHEAFDHVISA